MSCSFHIDEKSRDYVKGLTEVCASRDLGRVKSFYREWQESMELGPMPDDERLETEMHMMTLELPALEHLHPSSLRYLADRGIEILVREENGCEGPCNRNAKPDA